MNDGKISDTELLEWIGRAEPLFIWRQLDGRWIIDGDFFTATSGATLREALLKAKERMRQRWPDL